MFITRKNFIPQKIKLLKSGFTIVTKAIHRNNYETLAKWNELKKMFIESTPEDFLYKYIEIAKISGDDFDVCRLPSEDINFLVKHCLEQEGKSFNAAISNDMDSKTAILLFRDEVMGVTYEEFIKQRSQWANKISDSYNKILGKIKNLHKNIKKYEKKIKASNHNEEKLFQLKQNSQKLKNIENIIKYSIKNKELAILDILAVPSYNRDSFLRQHEKFLEMDIELLDPQYLEFPLRWCGFLSLAEFNRLYREWKAGSDITKDLIAEFYSSSTKEYLHEETINSKINEKRKQIIIDAINAFYEKKYATVILLLLPQIEGLLWELAELLNAKHFFIFKSSAGANDAFKAYFYRIDKRQQSYCLKNNTKKEYFLISNSDLPNLLLKTNRRGNKEKIGTIRMLIKESAFRFYFDIEFIDYFCEELYPYRNEILHGRNLDFGTVDNAAKKLLMTLMLFYYYENI